MLLDGDSLFASARGRVVVTAGELALLLAVGLVAGTVNALAGGGSLLTLPALIFLGLPPTAANATNRVAVLLQGLVAARTYSARGIRDPKTVRALLLPTCLGAALGAWWSVDLDEAMFRRLIGLCMLVMVLLMWLEPKRWLEGRVGAPPAHLPWSGPVVFFAIGLYGGFLQAGVGVFLLGGLVLLQGNDLLRANATKMVLVSGFTLPPLAIFLANDLVHWAPGLVLAVGAMTGAWLGARLSIAGGAPRIRQAVIVTVAVSGARLLGLW